jgi:hypothetical protein
LTGGRCRRKGSVLVIVYEIDGKTTRWIQNWLEDRQHTVVLDGVSLEAVSVDSGVPQGSVLGPGLFLFYINDLQSRLTSKIRLFADDTIIYLTIANEEDASTLQEDLNKLGQWENEWCMKFHPDKCNVLRVPGPSTEPWGTPESTLTASDETPSSTTVCCLSSNQFCIHPHSRASNIS